MKEIMYESKFHWIPLTKVFFSDYCSSVSHEILAFPQERNCKSILSSKLQASKEFVPWYASIGESVLRQNRENDAVLCKPKIEVMMRFTVYWKWG